MRPKIPKLQNENMKFHPNVAMNGSQPWITVVSFSLEDGGGADTPVAPSATNSTQNNNKGSQEVSSAVRLEIILILGMLLILIFLIYVTKIYMKRQRVRPAIVTAPNSPELNITTRRHGIDQSVIEAFPIIGYAVVKIVRSSKSPLECAICLSEFVNDDILRVLPGCRHVYHTDCIDMWLENHVTCPVCRSNLSDPEVLSGKRLLSMNSEFDDFDISSQISTEHELKSDNTHLRVKESRRAQSVAEGWDRFTLSLPEQMLKEIGATWRHQRSTSVQEYTFQGKGGWRDGKVQTFFKSFSCNGGNREFEDMTSVAEEFGVSNSIAASRRHLVEPSIHGEISETKPTIAEVVVTSLPVHERV